MVYRWLPWKWLVRRMARTHGFVDPLRLLSRLDRFAQPSEVRTPIELLRAGVAFHARGLMNTKAIQHNLDWVWPWWVQKQYDPNDESFLPRAFSITHVNLTHRNWTAVGLPGCRAFPIVDPRGLVTPFFDGWSIDAWIVADDGGELIPARQDTVSQRLLLDGEALAVRTESAGQAGRLRTDVDAVDGETVECRIACRAACPDGGWLVVSLRPFNPEGVSFVHRIRFDDEDRQWRIGRRGRVRFARWPDRHTTSTYGEGDVRIGLTQRPPSGQCECDVGLATAAAMYRLEPGCESAVELRVPLVYDKRSKPILPTGRTEPWPAALDGAAAMSVPDERFAFLYDAAVRYLVLLSPDDVYPGPYTYKRFWFRDAAFILNAMLATGMSQRAAPVLERFGPRQRIDGFFLSQAGEWDSNGEALWVLRRYHELTGLPPHASLHPMVISGGQWIIRKRCARDIEALHAGLLPAGFSAEHLGNNDFYYWDDFWGVAGLRAAAWLCRRWDDRTHAQMFANGADDLAAAIERSLERSRDIRRCDALPASAYRRMDAGAVGSVVASYPLRLLEWDDPRMRQTVDFLLERCRVRGAFFQDLIHSGLNAYLTLHLAQALLRMGDPRFFELVRTVADLASPTGQWPEAIHPRTGGGCMGDGQHLWASAEWVMMMRNLFVREEDDRLILGSGIPDEWVRQGSRISFGPTATPWGAIDVEIEGFDDRVEVRWRGQWRDHAPPVEARLGDRTPIMIEGAIGRAEFGRSAAKVHSVRDESERR